MAKQVKDAALGTREARRRLKTQAEPHWRSIENGLHLGYRKREKGGSWIGRRFTEAKKYTKCKLGVADDFEDADGLKTLSFQQAIEALRKWAQSEVRIEAGIGEAHIGPYTVANAMEDYLRHYAVQGKGLSVAKAIVNANILPELRDIRVDRLSTKKISDWLHKLATNPARLRTGKAADVPNIRKSSSDPDFIRARRATANRVLNVFKAALNYAWREGKVASDTEWRRVKPFKSVDSPVIRYLSPDECTRLVAVCDDDFKLMVQAALLTGCRYGELAKLRVHDFNPDSATVIVRESKSGQSRHVVLTDEGRAFFLLLIAQKDGGHLLLTHDNGMVWGKSHQHRPLKEACKEAKISPAISFHILRHTHGSILAMKGVPMPVIAKQLGHADTRMTEKHYAHLSPSYVADTIRQNFPILGFTGR